ncbi:hypothetical protein [Amycolatopsis alkalitolerans]|uniref:Uncharacterized protein n=1 Tax=Amycolatopsis alkalitolerans TaxID=2547244 RepID=A0A5C4MB54_9PSEU|nr:hypothetical protein [Amycolatopsis alkalitolerans]TNC29130.1 hypothetical protein FG385_03270 [Amycolatopsis alkalitolerans]
MTAVVLDGRRMTAAVLAAVVAAVVAGCQSGGGATTPSPTTAPASPSALTRPECADLVASGQALAATVGQLVQGTASREQVRAAAGQLSSAIDSARQTVGAEANAHLDDAKAALGRIVDAAGAQPPDLAGMRAAANDLVAALRAAAASCRTVSTSGR